MKIEADAKLVTIYVNSTDQWHGQPLYAAIVGHCKERGIAGATVMRCATGYGDGARLHTAKLIELAENLPVRIEIVDIAERIERLLPDLEAMIDQGIVAVSDVRVIRYLQDPAR